MNQELLSARDGLIEAAGRTSQGLGLGRIIGQIYALLFFSPAPLSLDDMSQEIKVSKGSVSNNIRDLEKWGAVRQIWVRGSRKNYYEAEEDFLRIIREGITPFLRRKLNSSLVTTAEARQLINYRQREWDEEDIRLADFYRRRLDLISRAQEQFALLFSLPGIAETSGKGK